MTQLINCDLHDYFEIVCMRQSNIKIMLHSDITYRGKAINLRTSQGVEYIEVALNCGEIKRFNLAEISTLCAIGNNIKNHNFELVL
ncbi:Rho-binding antiterminator [Pseudoalteromonas sp. SSM20]|uniref:Rho-binding antiterminator n=1 Tax=Pseudoalteromonas sp. SSM20 TaxID=3139394 RepID=UPI003BAAEFB6